MNNPMLNEAAFERAQERAASRGVMTLQGTINKTFLLLFLCVIGGMITWTNYQSWAGATWIITLFGIVVALITFSKPHVAPMTAPIYAFLEGLLLGVVSAMYNAQFKGIVFNAVAATVLVFFVMLFVTGVEMAETKWMLIFPTIRWSMIWAYSALPAFAMSSVLFMIPALIELFRNKETYKESEGGDVRFL